MKRQLTCVLLQATAIAVPYQTCADTLPTGPDVTHGEATFATPSLKQLDINQTSNRAVVRWESFDIGQAAGVTFNHPDSSAATLNIVDSTTSSTLSGSLSANGAVFLVNPHGVTVTPTGRVDAGGAFIASTLSVEDSEFMSGANTFQFLGNGGSVSNAGVINASDVLMLGSRVENLGDIVAPMGRVALGSASQATLDLSGDGFLQVLAPATVSGPEALVSNSGNISADGGLVQLKAVVLRDAVRAAVNMPGSVSARHVSGQDGAIILHGGEGGAVKANGDIDAGGSVALTGAVVDANFNGFTVGAGGHLSLTADNIDISANGRNVAGLTSIVENILDSRLGNLLRAGSHVTLQANNDITWSGGLVMADSELTPESGGQAGNLHLVAGRSVSLGGTFSAVTGDWSVSANAAPVVDAARETGLAGINMFAASTLTRFVNNNGHLTLEILDGDADPDRSADTIQLPLSYSGDALTARIDAGVANYDETDIRFLGDIGVAGAITLSGHLRTTSQSGDTVSLSGASVDWTNETSGGRLAGGLLQFVESDQVTRFGSGGSGPSGPGVDAVRLELGSAISVSRSYGDAEPGQSALGNALLSIASHNTVPTGSISLGDVLAEGSIAVSGPGSGAGVGSDYQLSLSPTGNIAFKGSSGADGSGPDGGGLDGSGGGVDDPGSGTATSYWIDLSGNNPSENSVPLQITPRTLTANLLDPSYTYGSPESAVSLAGVVNGDLIVPTGALNGAVYTFESLGSGFGFSDRLNAGSHSYTVTGISGSGLANYRFDGTTGTGTVTISQKPLNYAIPSNDWIYGSTPSFSSFLSGLLTGDDVQGVVNLTDGSAVIDLIARLPVGTYQSELTGLTGADAGNYRLSSDDNFLATHHVLPKTVTWHVNDVNSTYGTLADPGSASLSGVLTGDQVTGAVISDELIVFNSPVGNYTLRVNSLSGNGAVNYVLAGTGHRQGTLSIAPRPLTWQTPDGSSEYGITPTPGSAILTGVLAGEQVSGVTGLYAGTSLVNDLMAQTPAGSYTVQVTNLQGSDISNYVLAGSGNLIGDYQITRKSLSWAVGDATMIYGATSPPNSSRLEGLVGTDEVNAGLGIFDDDEAIAVNGGRLPAGEYRVRAVSLTGPAAGNYQLAPEGNTSGNLTINRRLLDWTLGSGSSVYGNPLHISSYSLNGVLSGDEIAPVISALTTRQGLTTRPDAGTWDAYITHLQGRDADNYELRDPLTHTPGQLSISRRPLSYNANTQVTYGDSFSPEFVTNLVEGDEAPVVQYVVSNGNGQTIGTYFSDWPFIWTESSRLDAGTYRIQPVSLSANAAQPLNYTLQLNPLTNQPFDAGFIRISPKEISYSISLSAPAAQNEDAIGNSYQAPYMSFKPSDLGGRLRASGNLDGVFADDDVTLRINEPYLPVSSQGYFQTGTYFWRGDYNLLGGDANNYRLAETRDASLTITPRVIQLRGRVENAVYGTTANVPFNVVPIAADNDPQLQAAFAGNHISIRPEAFGFEIPGDGVVNFRQQLQERLNVGNYSWWVGSTPLAGPDAENFVTAFQGNIFRVTPRPLTVTGKNPQLVYGDELTLNTLFDLDGVLLYDDAGFADEFDFGYLSGGSSHLQAGDYLVTTRPDQLTGEQARNYMLPDVSTELTVHRRPLSLDVDATLFYGDFTFDLPLLGIIPSDQARFDDEILDQRILTDNEGRRFSEGRPNAGQYTLSIELSSTFSGALSMLDNYELPGTYAVDIQPRPLQATFLNSSQSYGIERLPLFRFDPNFDIDDNVLNHSIGIMPGDDVEASFDLLVNRGSGTYENVVDSLYLPVAHYEVYLRGLNGSNAGNYTLTDFGRQLPVVQDAENTAIDYGRVPTRKMEIFPKLIYLSPVERGQDVIYGDAIRLAGLAGVLPDDDVGVSLVRNGDNLTGTISAGDVLDTSAPSVGTYAYLLDGLAGSDSFNYRLAAAAETEATINKRQLVYAIDNVIGQYGNFKGCENPFVAELCNLSVDSAGNPYADIWAPLELGKVTLFNWIEGDDITTNLALIDTRDGALLTLEDKPVPGTYFQVVTDLAGRDAGNYEIAATGNAPGMLNMTPRWVGWTTLGGFYSRDTGIVTNRSELAESSINPARAYFHTLNPFYGVEREHQAGMTPVVQIYRDGDFSQPWWGSVDDPTDVKLWNAADSGVYTIAVVDIEGPYADYYRPLPAAFVGSENGNVGFMIVTSLGDFDSEELNSALVESRARQWERSRELQEQRDLTGAADDDLFSPESDTSDALQGAGTELVQSSTSGTTATGTTGTTETISAGDNMSTRSSGYINALADYGVTGVTLEAGTGGQVEVDYRFGPGYVMVGAQVDAAGQLSFSYTGIEGAGSVAAGVSARTGVDGSLGNLGDGSASAGANAGVFAEGSFSYGYEDGRISYQQAALTGASGSASAEAGISGQYGSANFGATVYPPGTVGAGLGAGGGFDDGVLSFNLEFTLAIGLIGGSFDISGAIDVEQMGDGAAAAIEYAGRAAEEIGCQLGLGDCSSPTAEEQFEMELAKGREMLRMAGGLHAPSPGEAPRDTLRFDPVGRFAFLSASEAWAHSAFSDENATDEERSLYELNRTFFDNFRSMQQDLQVFNDRQTQLRTTFEVALRDGNAGAAVNAITDMTVTYNMDDLIASLNQKGRDLGVGVSVVNGEVRFVNTYE